MYRAAAVLFVVLVASAQPAWAKGAKKKGDAKAAKAPKKPEFKPVGGPLPPLPRPTELSLEFAVDATDAESFAIEGTAPTATTTATVPHMAWTVAQWRVQIGTDVRRLKGFRRALAGELRKAQKENFAVAARHLIGAYDSAHQLAMLSDQSLAQFNALYTSDRDAEIQRDPPEAARRVRLYLDRVQSLYGDAKRFVERTTVERKAEIVRIDDDAE